MPLIVSFPIFNSTFPFSPDNTQAAIRSKNTAIFTRIPSCFPTLSRNVNSPNLFIVCSNFILDTPIVDHPGGHPPGTPPAESRLVIRIDIEFPTA